MNKRKSKIDFGDLVTLPVEWFLIGMLVMCYVRSWEEEESYAGIC